MTTTNQALSPAEQRKLLVRIGKLVRAAAPEGWARVEVGFRNIGEHAEVVLLADAKPFDRPAELAELLGTLRRGMYEPGRGAWLVAGLTLNSDGTFEFDFDLDDEPAWQAQPDPGMYTDELAAFPREPEHIPGWWRLKARLPLGVVFRHARIVDSYTEGEAPVVDRPALAAEEIPHLLHYLEREPSVLTGGEPGPDIFSSDGDGVPESYQTDGTWIWHASVPHYLRKYGTPPEPELVAHIRAQKYQPPYVEHLVRRTAEADLLGRPRPKPSRGELAKTDGDIASELETVPDPQLADEEILAVLVRRLGEHGVWPEAYRIGQRGDGTWCLNFTQNGWEVARHEGGVAVSPRYFDGVDDAAQHLLGALLLHPARMTAGHETPLETAKELGDWPVSPVDGEPPLTLLRNKRLLQLVAGTTVVRFGEESGNLVHHPGVRFATTSLPLERERTERVYRLRRPLHVITGITIPWANMPGGAVAYVLPKTITEHLEDGSVEGTE
ncbi:TNT domain-containing protein [Amycolatopsis sp. cg5]|uniref:TNT domain-containing protein n=1 Tax=Amycolatopsis sp. cg5 TaxID=3238802 RepID=UPI00352373D5